MVVARQSRGTESGRQLRHVALTRRADREPGCVSVPKIALRFALGNNNLAGPGRFGGDVSVRLVGDDHWSNGSE